MRDLRKYPLTTEECIDVLKRMIGRITIDEGAVGDIRPLVLQEAIELFEHRKLLEEELKARLK